MMPHHLRLPLVILAFPVAYLLSYGFYQGYLTCFHVPTIPPDDITRVQYPNYHPVARQALRAFRILDAGEQQAIRKIWPNP